MTVQLAIEESKADIKNLERKIATLTKKDWKAQNELDGTIRQRASMQRELLQQLPLVQEQTQKLMLQTNRWAAAHAQIKQSECKLHPTFEGTDMYKTLTEVQKTMSAASGQFGHISNMLKLANLESDLTLRSPLLRVKYLEEHQISVRSKIKRHQKSLKTARTQLEGASTHDVQYQRVFDRIRVVRKSLNAAKIIKPQGKGFRVLELGHDAPSCAGSSSPSVDIPDRRWEPMDFWPGPDSSDIPGPQSVPNTPFDHTKLTRTGFVVDECQSLNDVDHAVLERSSEPVNNQEHRPEINQNQTGRHQVPFFRPSGNAPNFDECDLRPMYTDKFIEDIKNIRWYRRLVALGRLVVRELPYVPMNSRVTHRIREWATAPV